jgi:hypothetical protein
MGRFGPPRPLARTRRREAGSDILRYRAGFVGPFLLKYDVLTKNVLGCSMGRDENSP